MRLTTRYWADGIAIIMVSGALTRASAVNDLQSCVDDLVARGRRGLLLDLSATSRINMSGLAALVELAARRSGVDLGYCSLPKNIAKALSNSGLDRGLRIFESVSDGLSSSIFVAHTLTKTRAIILGNEHNPIMTQLAQPAPAVLLDVLGQPVIARILDQLGRFGLRRALIAYHERGTKVADFIDSRTEDGVLGVKSEPDASAASLLARLTNNHGLGQSDLIVLRSDVLCDIDLNEMLQAHRNSGADVTIASQTLPRCNGAGRLAINHGPTGRISGFGRSYIDQGVAGIGVYIFKPGILGVNEDHLAKDIEADLLPKILKRGGHIRCFSPVFQSISLKTPAYYSLALRHSLQGMFQEIKPMGHQIRSGIWMARQVKIEKFCKIDGPCYIGAGAFVGQGSRLDGVNVIGCGATIGARSTLKDVIALNGVQIAKNTLGSDLILHPEGSIRLGKMYASHTQVMQKPNLVSKMRAA